MISHPPQINSYEIRHGTRLRFTLNAAFAGNITWENLLDTILLQYSAVGASTVFHLVKVRRVHVWAESIVGSSTLVQVIFPQGAVGMTGDLKIHTDSSMGVQPAHLSVRPSRDSLASKYQSWSANTAFSLTAPLGAVVDVELSFVNQPGLNVNALNATVAATAGSIGYRGLDGLAKATSAFTPVATPWV
jgi:hypothetical protein